MATAQTIRERTDKDFDNIREEYREAMGFEPRADAPVSRLRAELERFYASGGHRQAGQRGIADDGNAETPHLQILIGNDMDWFWDSSARKWMVSYKLPSSDRRLVFEVENDQFKAIWGDGPLPPSWKKMSMGSVLSQPGYTFGGNIAEMTGSGSFEAEYSRIKSLALDEGKLPDWAAKDGEAMDIIFTAQAEGKDDEWVVEQLAKTQGFKERFVGLESWRKSNNLTTIEAVQGYLEYEAGIKRAYKAYDQNVNVTPKLVGELLNAGHAIQVVEDTVQKFKRMEAYKPALDAFNRVLADNGHQPLSTIQEMTDFVSGKASAELYDLWEASSIQESAEAAGLGHIFSGSDALTVAMAGDHNLQTAMPAMQKAAEMLLRMRHEVSIGQFDADELIDVSLGMAPRSGRSQVEIFEAMTRAINTAQGELRNRAKSHTGFSSTGTPQAASLAGLRQTQ